MSLFVVKGPNPRYRAPWHHNGRLLLGLIVFLGLTFSFSGGYSTDGLPLWHRLLLWMSVATLMVVQPVCLDVVVGRFLPPNRLGAAVSIGLASVMSIPLIAVQLEALKRTPLLPKEPDPWLEFMGFLTPPVLTIALFVFFLRVAWEELYLASEETTDAASQDAAPAEPSNAVVSSLATALSVQAQDHYLEIVTPHGQRFVRGRLKALVDADPSERGVQIHRSWWVADEAVVEARKSGRDWHLVLTNGVIAPLARSRVAQARERGWLDRVQARPVQARSA